MPDSANPVQQRQTIIEIRPYRGGRQCFEGPGVEPYWTGGTASRHARLFPVSAASKPFRCVSIAIPIEKQRLKTGGYDLTKTPSSGRRDGVLERKSLTNPSFVRISTWPAARLAL